MGCRAPQDSHRPSWDDQSAAAFDQEAQLGCPASAVNHVSFVPLVAACGVSGRDNADVSLFISSFTALLFLVLASL